MIKKIIQIILVMFICLVGVAYAVDRTGLEKANAKITFKIVDEKGSPIESVDIGIGFLVLEWWSSKHIEVKGTSDADGNFTASANASNRLGYTIKKAGFYISQGEFRFADLKNGDWQPWNPVFTVVMRKRENQVPMYARDTQMSGLDIPVIGKEVGFDLIEYDWVAPYGKGKHADFIFKADRRYVRFDDFDCTLTITFQNQYDGIQLHKENRKNGSVFKLPRFAPKTGYKNKLVRKIKRKPGVHIPDDYSDDNNYFFRVRSETRDGKLVKAMYGKIQGDILVDPQASKTVAISFVYFLNPDYTRNLESGENLFKNLSSREWVSMEQ